ncbi:Na(+)/glucose symporter [Anaerohalosphaera lusitana]|uniref:Na(+)/glucose symporter n=1 Tax=Anaerohalosphaera lusitana TaxID=1936003 RepID=A0A1U9NP29_9BACT|nr:sodium/solute symporter [Anaerohalosphaera lusitana]AQT69360.1 Na(+)/glucose symporter [Anaerohalosphaera lusitana]
MEFSFIDLGVFVLFVVSVITIGVMKSRQEKSSEDYFLAGRGLQWWLIGFSLIAANISTEQFVGMSGNGASHIGLAIASYEWMAAVTLVVVAFCFLPYFLRAGIFTMPEFLEVRYNGAARTLMAIATLLIYLLLLGAVTYSGALTIRTLGAKIDYDITLLQGSLAIGIIAMVYVVAGGLKACAWADLIQGAALIIGGIIIMFFAFDKLGTVDEAAKVTNVTTGAVEIQDLKEGTGAVERFWELNKVRMNMFLPSTDSTLPWTALLLGLWIPNFYYWGLNQYITQRTLGSASLAQGQKGIVFAAFMKLIVPFAIVVPGIIAFNLYHNDMALEAVPDNTPVMAKYYKANPDTEYVEIAEAPDMDTVKSWSDEKFLIAVYENEDAAKKADENPYVLPILKSEYEEAAPAEYTVFESEDKAWKSVNEGLAAEMVAYNEDVEAAADEAGAETETEKVIAYKYDTAFGHLLGNVLPQGVGLVGFVLAALLGAVVSSLAAMLNAASTIFSMDVYKKFISPNASQKSLVFLGRICVVAFTVVAVFLAPKLGDPAISNSIFTIIQESQGLISPGILAVFVIGLVLHRTPRMAGVIGLLTNIIAYPTIKFAFPDINFLNRMAICFGLCMLVMAILTVLKPLPEPIVFKQNTEIELKTSNGAKIVGIGIVILTIALYILFSPIGISKM